MGYNDHGKPFVCQVSHNLQNLTYHLWIQCRCRLIKEQDFRFHSKCSCNCHTLLLTAGKLFRLSINIWCHSNLFQIIQCFFLSLFFTFFQDLFLTDGTVFQGSHIVKQVKVLENHSYLGTILRDIYIFTGNVCSMIIYLTARGCFQHIQAAKQSGFTGTGGSDNTGYITSAYREVDVAQNLITSKGFSQMLYFKNFFTHDHFSSFFFG